MPTAEYAEILGQVETLLGRFVQDPAKLREESELVNDIGLDSLQVMEIVQEIEDSYDISFPLNDLSRIRTLREFVLQVQKEIEG